MNVSNVNTVTHLLSVPNILQSATPDSLFTEQKREHILFCLVLRKWYSAIRVGSRGAT